MSEHRGSRAPRAASKRHHLPTLRGQWQVLAVASAIIIGQWWVANELGSLLSLPRLLAPIPPLAAAIMLVGSVIAVVSPTATLRTERILGLGVLIVLTAANLIYIGVFTYLAFQSGMGKNVGTQLVIDGAVLWFMNVGVFGIAFWEVDGPGPAHRTMLTKGSYYDFLFPQQQPDVEPTWVPGFGDYLYTALTNAIAFSPTDAMPVTPTAKSLMAIQSITSIATLLVLVARAINIAN